MTLAFGKILANIFEIWKFLEKSYLIYWITNTASPYAWFLKNIYVYASHGSILQGEWNLHQWKMLKSHVLVCRFDFTCKSVTRSPKYRRDTFHCLWGWNTMLGISHETHSSSQKIIMLSLKFLLIFSFNFFSRMPFNFCFLFLLLHVLSHSQ